MERKDYIDVKQMPIHKAMRRYVYSHKGNPKADASTQSPITRKQEINSEFEPRARLGLGRISIHMEDVIQIANNSVETPTEREEIYKCVYKSLLSAANPPPTSPND